MRGVGCITPGALEIEGKKKASELISEVTKEGFDFSTTKQEFARCLSIKLGWQSDSLDNAMLPPLMFDHSIRVLTADG